MSDSVNALGLGPELFWLAATAAMTGLFWLPCVLLRLVEHGLWPSLQNPSPSTQPKSDLGRRLAAAHANAIENLAVFATLVLVAVLAHRLSGLTAVAALVYFWARLIHYGVYAAGIPVARTLAFAAGWAACAVFALTIFGLA